jgi:DNA invertase Pin-like site-specific DNA recombinase
MSKKQAYAYIRVSSRGQISGHGFDRQEETIRAYAKAAKVEIVKVYREAHTGTEADRPVFVEMLSAILENGVKTIVVESLDRLARDIVVQIGLLGELRKRDVALISANTGEEVTASDDPMREALVQIQGVFAMLDKKLLVRKLRRAREAKRAKGDHCEGTKPFGALAGEREILDRILTMRRANRGRGRMPFAAIAETLNRENLKTRSGKPWKPATLYLIVRRVAPKLTAAE